MPFDWKSTTFVLQSPGAATADRLADFKAYLAANKAAGLNTITLFSPVPVDPVTGEVKSAFGAGNAFGAEAKTAEYFGAFTIAAHEVGVKVIWKPQFNLDQLHTDNVNGHSTGASFNVANFLAGVKAFWTLWAPAAQRYGADMVVFSTENGSIAINNEASMRAIIAEVRKHYGGPLTYAETNVVSRNYGAGPDDIAFWDALDYIGVDAYNPVVVSGSLTYDQAYAGLKSNSISAGDPAPKVDISAVLAGLSAKFNKPVLFTEMGLRSVTGAASSPSDFLSKPGEVPDNSEQYNYFKAFLDIYQHQPWVSGMNIWNGHNERAAYPTHAEWGAFIEKYGRTNGDFLGKSSEDLLKAYWLNKSAAPLNLTALRNADGTFRSNDVLVGDAGQDTFSQLGGGYRIYGAAGADTAAYAGTRSGFTVTRDGAALRVVDKSGAEGSGTLYDVERIQFAGEKVAFDTVGNAGQAYRLYQAAFNRTPDAGGLGFQMKALDDGLNIAQVAQNFIASPEFSATYGSLNDTAFVNQLYQNVLHRPADAGGLAYHIGNLASGANTRATVLVGFSESPENQAALIGLIQGGMTYTI